MGYDVSYHPVDGAFIRGRVIPYVRGAGSLGDVLPDMIRIDRARWRAAEWAYKVADISTKESRRRYEAEHAAQKRKGGDAGAAPKKRPPAGLLPEWFDSDLHIWGRPFFITAETPEEVSEVIDRYCAAPSPEQVDAIAREELARLNPKLVTRVKPPRTRSGPTDAAIARSLLANLDLARSWLKLKAAGEPFVDEDGDEHDPAEAFVHNFPLMAVAFAAKLRPGWMARGLVWPTLMMGRAGLTPGRYFDSPSPLFGGLRRTFPQLDEALNETIVCNYELGGHVAPKGVRTLRRVLNEARDQIIEKLGYGETELRKIDEALYDAARRRLGFIEAAEIYSGIMGIMN
jgi:hypothetical protein